jgi:hypothetical protein
VARATTLMLLLMAATALAPALSAHARQQGGGSGRRPNADGGSQSYTTITGITTTALSNGVQIRIAADGILQYANADMSGNVMRVSFPQARNGTNRNFFRVDRYPVSYLQAQTPQSAMNGIGLDLRINNFVNTNASITTTPDGQGVLITVQSDRTIERGARRPGSGGGGSGAGGGQRLRRCRAPARRDHAGALREWFAVGPRRESRLAELMAAIAQKIRPGPRRG